MEIDGFSTTTVDRTGKINHHKRVINYILGNIF